MKTATHDWDEDAQAWIVTDRDEDGMPVDQFGAYETERAARRAAAQRRYGLKITRPVRRKV